MNLLKKSNQKWSFMIYNKVTKIWISKIFKIWDKGYLNFFFYNFPTHLALFNLSMKKKI